MPLAATLDIESPTPRGYPAFAALQLVKKQHWLAIVGKHGGSSLAPADACATYAGAPTGTMRHEEPLTPHAVALRMRLASTFGGVDERAVGTVRVVAIAEAAAATNDGCQLFSEEL